MVPAKSLSSVSAPTSAKWTALERSATAKFSAVGLAYTDLRRKVLRELWQAGRPLGAYRLADRLNERNGSHVAANSVYRVLEALQSIGLVWRVESQQAYVVVEDEYAHDGILLLCHSCGALTVLSDQDMHASLAATAKLCGFSPARQIIEVNGRCDMCEQGATLNG